MNTASKIVVVSLIVVVVAVVLFFLYKSRAAREKVSRFGKYQGYSEALYDGNERRSEYLTLSNGTRLAYDLILPTKKGIPASRGLPVLLKYTPYLRTFTIFDKDGKNIIAGLYNLSWKEKAMLWLRSKVYSRGHLMDPVFRTKYLERMLKHGYAVIVVERPGTGASFGVMDASFEVAAKNANEILDWIAAQRWCDGNIGMFGDSFQAMIQFATAAMGNPHLKAIFPTSSSLDNYSAVIYRGGVYNKTFGSFFSWATFFMESGVLTPVDSDKDGTLLAQARKERSGSTLGEKSADWFRRFPFHDSTTSDGKNIWEAGSALYPFIDRINRSGVPVYMTTGWYDIHTGDMFLWYANLSVPKRLVIRPADHSEVEENHFDLDYGAEAHRWFDYWLMGIDNGIMKEPPIHYYVMGASKKDAWRTSNQWPLENQKLTRFYFSNGKTGSVDSTNDGLLHREPADRDAADAYTVDYSATSGKYSRWYAINWPRNYPDMQANDKKALTYTTPPLEANISITGHPVIHLWFVTDAPDLDFFVYLEEVKGTKSTYITEGNLRASHRALNEAPFNNLGLPFHRHYKSDLAPILEGKPVELVFNLLPTSYLFRAGNRIRITVTCADADNFETPALNPAPKIRLLRDVAHASFVEFPIIHGP